MLVHYYENEFSQQHKKIKDGATFYVKDPETNEYYEVEGYELDYFKENELFIKTEDIEDMTPNEIARYEIHRNEEYREARERYEKTVDEYLKFSRKIDNSKNKISELSEQITASKERIEALKKEIQELESQIPILEKRVREFEKNIQVNEAKQKAVEPELKGEERRYNEEKTRILRKIGYKHHIFVTLKPFNIL